MVKLERWSADMPELDAPIPDYLGDLAAKNDALFARLHDERGPLVEIDHAAMSAWLDSASRDHDQDCEAAA